MEEDTTSRKRLKKKFLDRWENEGGRICDDLKKTAESHSPRTRKSDIPKFSSRFSTARNDDLPIGKSKLDKK